MKYFAEYQILGKLDNELKFGTPKPEKDILDEEYTPHSMRDYSFYRWVDYNSQEYEAHVIRETLEIMRADNKNEEIYILLVQG